MPQKMNYNQIFLFFLLKNFRFLLKSMQIMMIDSNDTKLRANNFKLSPITWSNFHATPHTATQKRKATSKAKRFKKRFEIERIYFTQKLNFLQLHFDRIDTSLWGDFLLSTFQYCGAENCCDLKICRLNYWKLWSAIFRFININIKC